MSYCSLHYHIVFRTYRSCQTINLEHDKDLYMFMYQYLKSRKCFVHRIGGMPDHIHLFISVHQTISISNLIHDLKLSADNFLNNNPNFPDFYGWGKKYCAISYNIKDKEKIVNYIKNQKKHHEAISTEEEFISLLKENGIDYNEEFLDD